MIDSPTLGRDILLNYVSGAGRNAQESANLAAGVHLGMTLTLRHPEYAALLHQMIIGEAHRKVGANVQHGEDRTDWLVRTYPLSAEGEVPI